MNLLCGNEMHSTDFGIAKKLRKRSTEIQSPGQPDVTTHFTVVLSDANI